MRSRLLPLLVLFLASTALVAQSAPQSPEPEPSTQSLLDRIQQLEKRISELEDHERKEAAAQTAISNSEAVTETPTRDLNHCLSASMRLINAMGVWHM